MLSSKRESDAQCCMNDAGKPSTVIEPSLRLARGRRGVQGVILWLGYQVLQPMIEPKQITVMRSVVQRTSLQCLVERTVDSVVI